MVAAIAAAFKADALAVSALAWSWMALTNVSGSMIGAPASRR
jgi:hypothetical protein